ncbi:MAG: hypothetical protein QNJ17_00025 [Desulfocapsaceae bacterium]|nr:hypothetical protein [Desulfocapsaceae bacterium]
MNKSSHQRQQDHKQNIRQEKMITNGKHLHDQAIGMALLKVLHFSTSIVQHEPRTRHRPQPMKYS